MIDPFNLALLAVESQRVVALRMWKLAWGGSAGMAEAYHMVVEKIQEGAYSTGRLMSGATPDSVVDGYLDVVRANVRRLSA